MPQRTPSPAFYRVIAVVFFVIGGVLAWWAIKSHEWYYWAFAAITLLNALMSGLKSLVVAEAER